MSLLCSMPASAASSPSKIPLPQRKATPPAEAAMAATAALHGSRIPKAVMTSPAGELSAWEANGSWGRASHAHRERQQPRYSTGDAPALCRRASPPPCVSSPAAAGSAPVYRRGHSTSAVTEAVDLDDQFLAKIRESRAGGSEAIATAPKISTSASRIPQMSGSGGGSPTRKVSPSPTASSSSASASPTSHGSAANASPSRIPIAGGIGNNGAAGRRRSSASPPRRVSPASPAKTAPQPLPSDDETAPSRLSALSKEGLHLELSPAPQPPSSSSPGSKIPLPRSSRSSSRSASPPKSAGAAAPTFGWSFSPERMLPPAAAASSPNKDNLPASAPTEPTLPGDDASATSNGVKHKKTFEAFVMTGDRMIKLAKTPANQDFKSKYRPPAPDASLAEVPSEGGDDADVQKRAQPAARRALVRNSKSEDQLNNAVEDEDDEDCTGSVNALLDTSGLALLDDTFNDASSSPDRNTTFSSDSPTKNQDTNDNDRSSNSDKNLTFSVSPPKNGRKEEEEDSSPPDELNTEELMSCSEHYNAASVLDPRAMGASPDHSLSSPEDTPGWSLLDSYHKQNGGENGAEVNANGSHRVVIAIGESPAKDAASPTSPARSDASNNTLKEEEEPGEEKKSVSRQSSGSLQLSSLEEDSDIESLHSYHPPVKVVDVPSAVRLAKRLYHLDGFKKTDVSRHLSRNTDYNSVVAEEYLKFFAFEHDDLDAALRQFLGRFCLEGETQERERVLQHFSQRYLECNPELRGRLFQSQDAVHTLTCALFLLNTDLHAGGLQRRMTCADFVENLSELNDGKDFPRDLLKRLYAAIRDRPIPYAVAAPLDGLVVQEAGVNGDGEDAEAPSAQQPEADKASAVTIGGRTAGGVNPFLDLPDPDRSVDYKTGYVMRKSCYDANGKKTKLGRRSWRMFFLSLRDTALYCFKDEKSARSAGAYADASAAVRVHHGLAVRATDYAKKQFVFRLHTADRAQYLFQTSDEKELLTWIDVLNYVVASLSAPQLPAPCSSAGSGRFQRPLLPSSKTRLSPEQQLESHEQQLALVRQQLEEHERDGAPAAGKKKASAAASAAYKEKLEYLQFEAMRYETYILTLRTKTNAHD